MNEFHKNSNIDKNIKPRFNSDLAGKEKVQTPRSRVIAPKNLKVKEYLFLNKHKSQVWQKEIQKGKPPLKNKYLN